MKKILPCLIAALLLTVASCSQNTAGRTSSARAAYGTPETFRAHMKKNQKSKKKAGKAAKKKRTVDPKQPYRRLPM